MLTNTLGCIFWEILRMAEKELLPTTQQPEIVDPSNVPVTFVDWIITAGEHEGVVNIVFGVIDHALKKPGDPLARVMVASRLRLSREFAGRMHTMLGNVLGISPQNEEGSQSPPPPKNLIN